MLCPSRGARITFVDEPANPSPAGADPAAQPGSEAGPVASEQPSPKIDPRFTYANERTFLAWLRTALAFLTAGLAITQFFRPFTLPFGRRMVGLPLILLGILVAFASLRNWRACESAMHTGDELPTSRLPAIVAVGVGATAVVAALLAAFAPGS